MWFSSRSAPGKNSRRQRLNLRLRLLPPLSSCRSAYVLVPIALHAHPAHALPSARAPTYLDVRPRVNIKRHAWVFGVMLILICDILIFKGGGIDSTTETGIQYGMFGWLEHYKEWGHRNGAWGVVSSGWRLQWHVFAITFMIVSAPVYVICNLMVMGSARDKKAD
jgi:hypothetical protein